MTKLHEVGIAYCLEHSGTRNEDESGACDWFDPQDHDEHNPPPPCRLVSLVFADDAEVEWVSNDEDCEHLSCSGVDQVDLADPAKVWRCDACGWTGVRSERSASEPEGPLSDGA